MNHWTRVCIGDIAAFYNGKPHEDCMDDDGPYQVINSRFIATSGAVIKRSLEQRFPLMNDDVLMVMSDVPNGNALARCYLFNEADPHEWTLNQRIGCFRTQKALPAFLCYALNRHDHYLSFDNGGTQTNLRKHQVLSCPIYLPPYETQQAIVAVLSHWDAIIKKINDLIVQKEHQFDWYCSSLMETFIPSDDHSQMVSDVYEFKRGTRLSKADLSPNGKQKCILYGELYHTYQRVIHRVISRTNKETGVMSLDGDILMPSATTSAAINLATASALRDNDVLLGSDINILRPKSTQICSEFMAYYLTYYKRKALSRLACGTTIMHLYSRDIMSLRIVVPDLEKQRILVRLFHAAKEEIAGLKTMAYEYNQQKESVTRQLLCDPMMIKRIDLE